MQLSMTQTTNDPIRLKTLVCLNRQQHDIIPDEYQPHKKTLSSRFGLVLIEDEIIVPKNLRTTIISLLHTVHPVFNKMTIAARHLWPKTTEEIQKKCESCIPCKLSGKNFKPDIPNTETNNLPRLDEPNEEIQLDFIGPITENNRRFYVFLPGYDTGRNGKKSSHTTGKSAFELHNSRKPNTEISNLLNLDKIEKVTKRSVSAKPDNCLVKQITV